MHTGSVDSACARLLVRLTQVSDDERSAGQAPEDDHAPPPPQPLPGHRPEHLSELIGSLDLPLDLGRNCGKYLTYADRGHGDGAASE